MTTSRDAGRAEDRKSRHQVHDEERGAFARLERLSGRLLVLCAILLMAVGSLAIALIAVSNSGKSQDVARGANTAAGQASEAASRAGVAAAQAAAAAHQAELAVLGGCQLDGDLARLRLPPKPTPPLLAIVADGRVGYIVSGCVKAKGPLPPPDPRIRKYLPPGLR